MLSPPRSVGWYSRGTDGRIAVAHSWSRLASCRWLPGSDIHIQAVTTTSSYGPALPSRVTALGYLRSQPSVTRSLGPSQTGLQPETGATLPLGMQSCSPERNPRASFRSRGVPNRLLFPRLAVLPPQPSPAAMRRQPPSAPPAGTGAAPRPGPEHAQCRPDLLSPAGAGGGVAVRRTALRHGAP